MEIPEIKMEIPEIKMEIPEMVIKSLRSAQKGEGDYDGKDL